MEKSRERQLAATCARQYGIITRHQLINEIGASPRTVTRLLDNQRLDVLRQGVYRLTGLPVEIRSALYAATTGTRVSAVSHRSAAWLARLPGGAELVEISSPRWRRVRGDALANFELVVHESFHLTERDVIELDGIWRTRTPRTLVDLGASVALGHIPHDTLVLAMQDAVRRNLTSVEQLETTFARLAPHIRFGAQHFRDALDEFRPILVDAESTPEIRVGRALLDAGLRVIPQYELKLSPGWTVRLDFYLPDLHHAVEVSPFCTHGGAVQREYDIARALRVRRLYGIEISTVGDDEIDHGCPELIALLGSLRRAAA